MRHLRALLPLYLSVALGAITNIFAIPAMVGASGLQDWSNIGIGQAVGGVVATVVAYGWGVSGPNAIARADALERVREYRESARVRLLLAPPLMILGIVITISITGAEGAVQGVLGVLSIGLAGMSPGFVFLGTGQLWTLFFVEALPRYGFTAVGTVVLLAFPTAAPAIIVPALTSVGVILGVVASHMSIHRANRARWSLSPRPIASVLLQQRHGLVSSLASGALQILPTFVVGWFATSLLAQFVFYDKLLKQAITFVSPVFNWLQGWVPQPNDRRQRAERLRKALWLSVVALVICVIGAVTFGAWAVTWLSAGEVTPSLTVLVLCGGYVGLIIIDFVSARVGLVLYGHLSALARLSAAGALVGVVLLIPASLLWGLEGALSSICIGVSIRLVCSLWVVRREQKASPRDEN